LSENTARWQVRKRVQEIIADNLSEAGWSCGWKVFEAPGVEPVFLDKEQAIDYATGRACFRSGAIRILKSNGDVERIIPFNETERRL